MNALFADAPFGGVLPLAEGSSNLASVGNNAVNATQTDNGWRRHTGEFLPPRYGFSVCRRACWRRAANAPEQSAQRALTPAQLIAAAKARLDKDAVSAKHTAQGPIADDE